MILQQLFEAGPGGSDNYAENLAQQIFDKRQDISSEEEVLNQAYHIVANDMGQKTARYKFNYDADFPSDVVSNYFHLQKQGVAEGQGHPSDNDIGTTTGGTKMSLGQWKQMWMKKMPNADFASMFKSPPNMQGSAIAYFDGWMNNPDARWDPQQGVAEAAKWRTQPDAHDLDTDGSYIPKGGIKSDNLAIRQKASKTQSEKDPKSMAGMFGAKYAKKHGVPTKQLMKNIPLDAKKKEQGVAEGSVDKKPYPKTWHDVDPKIGKLVDKMSPEEKVKKGYTNPSILKKNKQQGVAEETLSELNKDTSWMNKQSQDFYNKNPNFKRDDRETKSLGNNRLATRVSPTGGVAKVKKKPMTPFESMDAENSPVASAITRRILMQRSDLLSKYGPVLVTQAIDEVADFVGDVEEIGSSDVSGWIKQVEQMLANNPPEAFDEGVAEGRHGYDDYGYSLAPGHDEGEPVYSQSHDRRPVSRSYNLVHADTGKQLMNKEKTAPAEFGNEQHAQAVASKLKYGTWIPKAV